MHDFVYGFYTQNFGANSRFKCTYDEIGRHRGLKHLGASVKVRLLLGAPRAGQSRVQKALKTRGYGTNKNNGQGFGV